jgi:ABC-type transporter Mla subunit MlaD
MKGFKHSNPVPREDDKFEKMVRKTEAALDNFSIAMGNINDVMGDPKAREKMKAAIEALPQVLADLRTTVQGIGTTVDTADRNLRNLEGLTTDHHERSGNRIHGCRLVGVQVGKVVGAKFSDLGKASGQAEEMVQSDARRWK